MVIKLNLVEHYVLEQIPATKTHLIAISKIMLQMTEEEQYMLKFFQIIKTHQIVLLIVIWLIRVEH
jgi:hypothetical protein